MKLNGFIFVLYMWSCIPCFSSEIPEFLQKYYQTLPQLQQYNGRLLDNGQKATIIVDYLCSFFSKKQELIINGKDLLINRIKLLMQEEKPLLITIKGFPF